MPTPSLSLSYCAAELQRHDNDRFLCTLFAPVERREALFALYAFNLEIAKTREVVSEPLLGQIRLQWWRDAIAGIYGGTPPPAHAVLEPLAAAIARHGLSRVYFDRLIDSREADLTDEPPASLEALVAYAETTAVPLMALGLEILGAASPPALDAARHAGTAVALSGLLRAVPFHARARRLYLPSDLLAAHGVRTNNLFEGKGDPGLAAVAEAVANRAASSISEARTLRKKIPRVALPALLPLRLAAFELRRLRRARYNVFAPHLATPSLLRPLPFLAGMLRGW